MQRTITINDTLPGIIGSLQSDVADLLREWLDDNADRDTEPDTPCLHSDLDYSGRVHGLVDGAVPIYTGEQRDLWYLYGDEFEAAFDDAGIGNKSDDDWPMGWKPAAIYCYMEQQVSEWYDTNADAVVEQWWNDNRPVRRAVQDHEAGEFDGLVVSDLAEIPLDYNGAVLHINDHGNATLYEIEHDTDGLMEIDSIV